MQQEKNLCSACALTFALKMAGRQLFAQLDSPGLKAASQVSSSKQYSDHITSNKPCSSTVYAGGSADRDCFSRLHHSCRCTCTRLLKLLHISHTVPSAFACCAAAGAAGSAD